MVGLHYYCLSYNSLIGVLPSELLAELSCTRAVLISLFSSSSMHSYDPCLKGADCLSYAVAVAGAAAEDAPPVKAEARAAEIQLADPSTLPRSVHSCFSSTPYVPPGQSQLVIMISGKR